MVISWVFLVPIAIVVARYYKKLFPDILVFGFQFWFSVHFPTMILAFGLSFIAFLVVLSGALIFANNFQNKVLGKFKRAHVKITPFGLCYEFR
jgi:hypothetical protein